MNIYKHKSIIFSFFFTHIHFTEGGRENTAHIQKQNSCYFILFFVLLLALQNSMYIILKGSVSPLHGYITQWPVDTKPHLNADRET